MNRSHSRTILGVLVPALLTACTDAVTTPRPPQLHESPRAASTATSGTSDSVPGGYIILFRNDIADVEGQSRRLVRAYGGRTARVWNGLIKGFSVREMPDAAAEALRRDPMVRLVEPVRVERATAVQNLPFNGVSFQTSDLWALDRIDHFGSAAYNGQFQYTNTGAGTHIYIVDSGVRAGHVEFAGRIGNGECFVIFSLGCEQTHDPVGHGNAVASAAAGTTYGVAKGATIHPVRIDGGAAGAYCDDIATGLNWVGGHVQRPAVVNLSYQGDCFAVRDAIDALVAYNILVFKAAGNDNIDAFDYSRGNRSAGSVVVGALTPFDGRSGFSNWGSLVTLMAPGQNMLLASAANNTASASVSGTSFAAPTAAGVAATLLQVNPGLTAASLKTIMLNNASAVTITNGQGVANRVLFSNFSPPLPPFDVLVDGPNDVVSGSTCNLEYIANVSGGVAPVSFFWETSGTLKAGQGSGTATVAFPVDSPSPWADWVQVTVTDNAGRVRQAGLLVTASPNGQVCAP